MEVLLDDKRGLISQQHLLVLGRPFYSCCRRIEKQVDIVLAMGWRRRQGKLLLPNASRQIMEETEKETNNSKRLSLRINRRESFFKKQGDYIYFSNNQKSLKWKML